MANVLRLSFPKKTSVLLFIILAFTWIAYSNIFSNGFAGDDVDFILKWKSTNHWHNVLRLLQGDLPLHHEGVYRPVRSLFYLVAKQVWGTHPFFYHVFSLLVHSVSTVLVFFISRKLTKNIFIAFAVGLLFGLHPIHTESVTYITSSFDAVGYVFFFAAFLCYLKASEDKNDYLSVWYFVSILLAFIAYFSEEMTLTLPLLLTLYSLCFIKDWHIWKPKVAYLFPYYLGAFLFILIRFFVIASPLRGSYLAGNFFLTMLASLKAFLYYIYLCILPIHLSLDHTLPKDISTFSLAQFNEQAVRNQSLFEPFVIISLTLILGLLSLAWYLRKRQPIVTFAIGWFCLALLPVLNIIPNYTLMLEAYVYTASFGFCLILGWLVVKLSSFKERKYRGIIYVLVGFLALFYGYRTLERNKDWKNEIALWEATAKLSPQNGLVLYKLGSAYQEAGMEDQAVTVYSKALEVNGQQPYVHHNLGVIYANHRDREKASEQFNKAIALNPQDYASHKDLGILYLEQQDLEQAAYHFEVSLQNSNDQDDLLKQLATIYNNLGFKAADNNELDKALEHFKKAVTQQPSSPEGYTNIGTIYAQKKNYREAAAFYRKALAVEPHYTPAQQNLTNALRLQKE